MTAKKNTSVLIRKVICILIASLLATSLVSCGNQKLSGTHWEIADYGDLSNDLVGTLKYSRYYIYFTSETEGYFQGMNDVERIAEFTYTIEDDTISVNFNSWSEESSSLDMNKPITLLFHDNSTLLSSMGFMNTVVTFTKK